MQLLVLSLVFVGACGGHTHWIDHSCAWSLAAARDAIVFIDEGGVVLRRDGSDHRLGFTGCLVQAKDHTKGIVALADGWSALVYGYGVHGGNWIESGSVVDAFACIVDVRTRHTRSVPPELLSHDLRQFAATVGARTGWLYVHEVLSPVHVVDLVRGVAAELADAGKTIVEIGTTVRTIEPELVQIDQEHPIYRSTLVVKDFDASVWPPALRDTRRIAVGGRTDRVVVSDDGRWAAYDGSPYYVGIETQGLVGDLGLVDLASLKIAFETLGRPGSLHAGDVVSRGDVAWVLAASDPDPHYSGSTSYMVSWLDLQGKPVGTSAKLRSQNLVWLPSRSRVLASDSCALELRDLPLPK